MKLELTYLWDQVSFFNLKSNHILGDEDNFPRGLVFDYTNKQPIPNSPNRDTKDNLEIPRPSLLFIVTDGSIVGYHFIKTNSTSVFLDFHTF